MFALFMSCNTSPSLRYFCHTSSLWSTLSRTRCNFFFVRIYIIVFLWKLQNMHHWFSLYSYTVWNMYEICFSVHLLIILIIVFSEETWSPRSRWRGFNNCRKWSTLAGKFWEVHILFKEESEYSFFSWTCLCTRSTTIYSIFM